MTVKASAKITLGIKGPFICSATAPAGWGLDATFDRDYLGRPYIDRSHIKGKLREALTELGADNCKINDWLGDKGELVNGNILLSDFRLADKTLEKNLKNISSDLIHRIRMDEERGVAADNALMMFEEIVQVNSVSDWDGTIVFFAKDEQKAKQILNEIVTGLKWISAFGAEKGVGFGKLCKVIPGELKTIPFKKGASVSTIQNATRFSLVITTEEPLMLGDVKIKDNFQESRDYIYGSAIKAALAQAMNTVCGVERPAASPIDSKNSIVAETWPLLTKYFSQVRFTHAFPSLEQKRPRIIPFSVVKTDKHYDVALSKEARTINGIAPTFQTDWKASDYPAGFGWAPPRKFAKTRTAIDEGTRQAKKGSMFTYQYVYPLDSDGKKIYWISDVSLEGVSCEDVAALQKELFDALSHLELLGKRASRVKVEPREELPKFVADTKPGTGKQAIITLQSDALMIDPTEFRKEQTAENLRKMYENYFREVFGTGCSLFNFFAMQKMLGGYLQRRRNDNAAYYPFFLTTAGSVFVLDGADCEKLQKALATGLPLPPWAGVGPEAWKTCPFVPENGFGEIALIHESMKSVLGISEGGETA